MQSIFLNLVRERLVHARALRAFGAIITVALAAATAHARYVPDTALAPNGVVDIGIRGNAVVYPEGLYSNIEGDGFVTIAERDDLVAVCAYDGNANLRSNFGNSGCYTEILSTTEVANQLLVGKSGYWVFITDIRNSRRFTLLRLTPGGQPDVTYGPAGRRSFDLPCTGTDAALPCPDGMQPLLTPRTFIAETSDMNLWLLATRKTVTAASPGGADQGVVFHVDKGRTITSRADLWDALPADWIPSIQASVSAAIDIVAHGDGVLVQLRTNQGYVLTRVDATGATDKAFGSQGIVTSGGDSALPTDYYPPPVVAADNTFLWGLPGGDSFLTRRSRFDARGAPLGPLAMTGLVRGASVVPPSPPSFAGSSVTMWVGTTAAVGRWIASPLSGTWDQAIFGGHDPFQPSTSQAVFALTRDESKLAMLTGSSFVASSDAKLTVIDTRSTPQPIVAQPLVQANARLDSQTPTPTIDPSVGIRVARLPDGSLIWQRVSIDPSSSVPVVTTFTLTSSAPATTAYMTATDLSASGERWVVRAQTTDATKPYEFYADLLSGSTGSTPHRINVDAIRADMPPFTAFNPYSNPVFLNVDIGTDGSGLGLIEYQHASGTALSDRLALIRWSRTLSAAGEYVATFVWSADISSGSLLFVQRDAQGRIVIPNVTDGSVIRLDLQGARDVTFGQSGRLDLFALGFVATDLGGGTFPAVRTLPDGSAWIATTHRLVLVDRNGQPVAQVDLPRPAPSNNSNPGYWTVKDLLAESDGGALVVYSNGSQYRLLRYLPSGDMDTQFGFRGAEALVPDTTAFRFAYPPGFLPPNYNPILVSGRLLPLRDHGIAVMLNDAIGVYRYDPSKPGPGATVPAVEFYNTTLDHYFMTSDVTEMAGIDAGAAGPGWQRTGESFPVYATLADAPGDGLDVCRFYGSAVPLARSPNGRTGPNSHFYSVSGAECDSINAKDKAWQYEGPRMALTPVPSSRTCAAGRQPVYRAYNNGYQFTGGVWVKNDANHRYSTKRSVIAEMVGKGWNDEGAVFCVPN